MVLVDWIVTFILCILLICAYCVTLSDTATYEILHPVVVEIPNTNRNLNV